jgi:hypothetical protein
MESGDLIFNSEPNKGIYSGGFSIKNYFLNNGISPITTLNQQGGSNNNNVSDLFNNLVVPASLYYRGGSVAHNRQRSSSNNDDDDDAETDVVDDHLYNELLKMVSGETKIEKRKSRRAYKKTIRQKSRKSK